jgi:hypothetical protein
LDSQDKNYPNFPPYYPNKGVAFKHDGTLTGYFQRGESLRASSRYFLAEKIKHPPLSSRCCKVNRFCEYFSTENPGTNHGTAFR